MDFISKYTKKAEDICIAAECRGENVHGIKPWYSSVRNFHNGANVAFIGANPGGGQASRTTDDQLGVLSWPYDDSRQYNAWLDDMYWESSSNDSTASQLRVRKTFSILLGARGEDMLRTAACFNVVPVRSSDVSKLSKCTWSARVSWCLDVAEYVAPELIICLGNSKGRSAWSVFAGRWRGTGLENPREEKVYGTFLLKRGEISQGVLRGTSVIGLPHLSRVDDLKALRRAAEKLDLSPCL